LSATAIDLAAEQKAAQQALQRWFGDQPVTVQPLGAGHIHGTWLVTLNSTQTNQQRYVLQRINQAVFASPDKVMANLLRALPEARAEEQPASSHAFPYALPAPIAARSGDYLVQSGVQVRADGSNVPGQWRLANYIEQSRTLQMLASSAQAEAAGRAFGEFQYWLAAQHSTEFVEVIPGFHQLPQYLQALLQAAVVLDHSSHEDQHKQKSNTRERALFDALQSRNYAAVALEDGATALIHGDCKLNNLLFAANHDQVVAVLDLDTMMHGPWWLDFGDLVRSATCSDAGEFNEAWYPALVRGFFIGRTGFDQQQRQVQRTEPLLTEALLATALQAPAYMTYMLCVRFLTDHLRGDEYFRVAQHGDNLRRAEAQYRLLMTLESSATRRFMRGVLEELF